MEITPEIIEQANAIGNLTGIAAAVIPAVFILLLIRWKPTTAKIKALKCALFPGAVLSYCLGGPLVRWFYGFSFGMKLSNAMEAWLLLGAFLAAVVWPVAYWLIKRKEKQSN